MRSPWHETHGNPAPGAGKWPGGGRPRGERGAQVILRLWTALKLPVDNVSPVVMSVSWQGT